MTDAEMIERREHEHAIQRERRFQTVLLTLATTLLVGFIGWSGGQLVSLNASAAVTTEKFAELHGLVAATYRSEDAKRDISEVTNMINLNTRNMEELKTRVQHIETRVDKLERR
jgi:hypothetical protein